MINQIFTNPFFNYCDIFEHYVVSKIARQVKEKVKVMIISNLK